MRRVSEEDLDKFLKTGKTSQPLASFAADMAFDILDYIAELDMKNKLLKDFATKYGTKEEQ